MYNPRFHRRSEQLFTGVIPAAVLCLAGCAANRVTGAAAEGPAYGAVIPGISVIEGAAVGAVIGGLANAVWADRNNDGYVDGYVQNGQYYTGTPQGYDATLGRVATGALGGAALGSVAGAVIPGLSILEGAVIGAAVGGPAGAIWADRDNDGRVDGYVYNGRYYAGTPAMAAPTYTAPVYEALPPDYAAPVYGERDDPPPGAVAVVGGRPTLQILRAGGLRGMALMSASEGPMVAAIPGPQLRSVQVWHSTNGSLTRRALSAMLQECADNWDGVTPDCEAAARAGADNFSVVPESARHEFAFLFKDSCPPGVSVEACIHKIEATNIFRSLPRALLEPRPKTMDEGIRTLFTVSVRDSGKVRGLPGLPTDVGVEHEPTTPGQQPQVAVIPYSERMCFNLTVKDLKTARIEPEQRRDMTIERGRVCMDVAQGGGGLKYDPSWWVTPLTGDDLQLYLDTEYFVGKEKRQFKYQPRPLVIDVTPKPSLWDRTDAFIRHATGTVNLAIGLAQALGALFTIIAGWAIWSVVKKWRAARKPPE